MRGYSYQRLRSPVAYSAVLALVLGMLVACSSEKPKIEGPWAVEFEQAMDSATSDLEREILADGKITDAEFKEAAQLYLDCLAGHDVEVKLTGTGTSVAYETRDGERYDEFDPECRVGSLQYIEPLYVDSSRNPENVDLMDLLADCLVRKGAAEPGFSGRDLNEEMTTDTKGVIAKSPDVFQACAVDPQG